jgi:hypothetical protein
LFKHTAVALSLLALSSLASAQQPVFWPWQPVQVWAVPANGQALPFPTPFWLWVMPPAPTMPAAKAEPPVQPAAATISAVVAAPAPVPTQTVAPATAPLPAVVPMPAPEAVRPAAPAEPGKVAVTPLPHAVPVEVVPAIPVAATPVAPVRAAPVVKKAVKPATKATARKARKLCFKDGKLDVCQ